MWASNRERVSGVPTVGHLGKRLGHTPQSCGHTTPLLRIKGGEFMSRAVWDVSVPGHDSSLLSAGNVSAAPSLGGLEPCIGMDVTRIVGKEPLPARDPCNAVGARRLGGACL